MEFHPWPAIRKNNNGGESTSFMIIFFRKGKANKRMAKTRTKRRREPEREREREWGKGGEENTEH